MSSKGRVAKPGLLHFWLSRSVLLLNIRDERDKIEGVRKLAGITAEMERSTSKRRA